MGKIIYSKLKALMEVKGLTTYKIRKEKIISESTLQNIRNEKRITTDAIASLCQALNCQPGDILEYVQDEQPDKWYNNNQFGINFAADIHPITIIVYKGE